MSVREFFQTFWDPGAGGEQTFLGISGPPTPVARRRLHTLAYRYRVRFGKRNRTPHKRFSKMISQNAKNLENVFLAEPCIAVMFPCRTLTRSEKISCRTLKIAEPKALHLEKDYLAKPWNAESFENAQRCRNCSRNGENYKIPLPVRPPKLGKNYRKMT